MLEGEYFRSGRTQRLELPQHEGLVGTSRQKSSSIEAGNDLYARAFVIDNPGQAPGDQPYRERIVMVVLDAWTCSIAIKAQTCAAPLWAPSGPPSIRAICGSQERTRTAVQAAILHDILYNVMNGGFDPHVFECIVEGIFEAIESAVLDLGQGRITMIKQDLPGLGRNRSSASYQRNDANERLRPDRFGGTDPEFLQLSFERQQKDMFVPAGVINWFPLHTTCRGQSNTAINGDHKGWAAQLLEQAMSKKAGGRFIAAFANSNCGDVSGNFRPGPEPVVFEPADSADPAEMARHKKRMEDAGYAQFKMANGLLDYRHG